MDRFLNKLFTIIATPIGIFLVGDGIYLSFRGKADYGVFLILCGALMIGPIVAGWLKARSKAKKAEARKNGKKGGKK